METTLTKQCCTHFKERWNTKNRNVLYYIFAYSLAISDSISMPKEKKKELTIFVFLQNNSLSKSKYFKRPKSS